MKTNIGRLSVEMYRALNAQSSNKHGNRHVVLDGITFDSKAEAKRYAVLKLLERAKKIRDLEVHKRFDLRVNGILVCKYESDFCYGEHRGGSVWVPIVEDVKGQRTYAYTIKKRLMHACHGIEIREVEA